MRKLLLSLLCIVVTVVFSACDMTDRNKQETNDTEEEHIEEQNIEEPESVQDLAKYVLNVIANKNMEKLATYVHPDKGLLFSPYVYIQEDALVFSQDEVKEFFSIDKEYVWGIYDGSGEIIKLKPSDYYEEFVYKYDFQHADQVLVDEIQQRGSMINNIKETFPNSSVVEFHIEGTEEYGGMDWASLNLVFELDNDNHWKLVAIVHDKWTS